jgi:hypothetical protein
MEMPCRSTVLHAKAQSVIRNKMKQKERRRERTGRRRKIRYFNIVSSRPTAVVFHIRRKPVGD